MYHTNMNYANENLNSLVDMALNEKVVNIETGHGNIIMLDEAEYRGLLLTIELQKNPEFLKSLIETANAPDSEFVDESEVKW